jgi:hypothetical protein
MMLTDIELQQLVKILPAKFGAEFVNENGGYIQFYGQDVEQYMAELAPGDDIWSAKACFLLLNELELDYRVTLWCDDQKGWYGIAVIDGNDEKVFLGTPYCTRTMAIVRACLGVWGAVYE